MHCIYVLHLGRCLQAVGWIIGLQSPPARSSGHGCPEPLIQPGRRCRHFVISQCLHQHPQIHKYKCNGFINTPKYTNTYTNTFVWFNQEESTTDKETKAEMQYAVRPIVECCLKLEGLGCLGVWTKYFGEGGSERQNIVGGSKYWGWIKAMRKMRQSDCYDHKRRTRKSLPTQGTRAHEYYECVWYWGWLLEISSRTWDVFGGQLVWAKYIWRGSV